MGWFPLGLGRVIVDKNSELSRIYRIWDSPTIGKCIQHRLNTDKTLFHASTQYNNIAIAGVLNADSVYSMKQAKITKPSSKIMILTETIALFRASTQHIP